MKRPFSHHIHFLRKEGLLRWLYFRFHRLLERLVPAYTLLPIRAFLGCRVYYRARTSDLSVFYQVFYEEQYKRCIPLTGADAVIDAGANAGYAAIYFHRKCPACKMLLAVEPDAANFALLQRNVAPYPAIRPIQAALWSRETALYPNAAGYAIRAACGGRRHDAIAFAEDRWQRRVGESRYRGGGTRPFLQAMHLGGFGARACDRTARAGGAGSL